MMYGSRNNQLLVTDLPDEILEKIMLNLSFDEIAHKRIVNSKFDRIGQGILNHKCQVLKRSVESYMMDIKTTLPRRDSARQLHRLNGHYEILNIMNVILNWLLGRYGFYIKSDLCCFIPGKIIDEGIGILRFIKDVPTLNDHWFHIGDEFREIAVMAEEHFKEVIEPSLKNALIEINAENSLVLSGPGHGDYSVRNDESMNSKTSRKSHYHTRRNRIAVSRVKAQIVNVKSKLRKLKKRVECLEQKLGQLDNNSPLEFSKRLFLLIKHIWVSNYDRMFKNNTKSSEASTDQMSMLEQKMDRMATLLNIIVFILLIMVITYCL